MEELNYEGGSESIYGRSDLIDRMKFLWSSSTLLSPLYIYETACAISCSGDEVGTCLAARQRGSEGRNLDIYKR